ncbi:unnamed protein product [Protopolystoma xenopodis]|uniref:IF140 C-terminal TPR domain-containing protein n=1 Tax=Protopolystoma xenopodis TaxID=117903 RepID=A0A448X3J4_9PLAT|nr:unnamed protein product [Protopolystoma xenopodis]
MPDYAEIEDSQNYEKAASALTEAFKVLIKASTSLEGKGEDADPRKQSMLQRIKLKAILCKRFSDIRE